MVAVVNGTQSPQNGLKVIAKLYDLSMNEKFSREASVDVDADGVARFFAIPEPADISSTYFLNLQLLSSTGQIVSRNFYWLSVKPDVLNFEKTEWYYTPQTAYADFSALQTLPPATVKASFKQGSSADRDAEFHVTVENAGKNLAFLVHLRLTKGKEPADILPVFWEDNYISLLPGERRVVQVRLRKSDLGSAQANLIVDGFNSAPQTIRIAH
jgi:exo-1,4-beta-D-glucosaminidase